MGAALLGFFSLFLILGVPISVCIGMTNILSLSFFSDVPLVIVITKMFSGCDSFPLMAVPFFILAGLIMERGDLSARLIDFCMELVGPLAGGLGLVTVLASMFFAALSGSGPATVAAVGGMMIPAMVKHNYNVDFSASLTAVAGSLGPIIPPSILFVTYGVVSNVSIGALLISGIVPGVLLGIVLMIATVIISKKRGYKGNGKKFNFNRMLGKLKSAFLVLLMPVLILGGIYTGIVTPTESALVAIVYALVLTLFIYRSIKLKDLPDIFVSAALTSGMVMFLVANATALSWIMTNHLIPQQVSKAVIALTSNKVLILLLLNLILLFLGCVIDQVSAILIVTPLFMPIMEHIGVHPVQFGCILVTNLCLGLVTPPVGTNLFVACAISKRKIENIIKDILILLAPCLAIVLLLTFVPEISLALPRLLGMIK